jgi:hypothetical protein
MLAIAADPKHLGARIAITSVLHTWGSAMTHHPHVHMPCWKHVFDMTPGGGLSPDGKRWIAARPNFFLPVLVLSRLFRRLMLEKLAGAHKAGRLTFFGEHAHLAEAKAFAAFLSPLKRTRWFVYSKRPFAGPKAVLAYLARYTHRVAISNSRLIAADAESVTFKVKDYRVEGPGRAPEPRRHQPLAKGQARGVGCCHCRVPSHRGGKGEGWAKARRLEHEHRRAAGRPLHRRGLRACSRSPKGDGAR